MSCRTVAALALAAPASALIGSQQAHGFLGASMRPEAVASVLLQVEDEWKAQADLFTQCTTQQSEDGAGVDCNTAPRAFEKSCGTVVKSVVQGSSGDKEAINEYLATVCRQGVMNEWHKSQCVRLSATVNKVLTGNSYENREHLDVPKLCTGFWTEFLKEEQTRLTEEQKQEDAAKAKAEADAEEKAKADAKAAAEAQAEAEAKAKTDAEAQAAAEAKAKAEAVAKAEADAKAEEETKKAAPKVEWPKSIDDVQADKEYHSNFTKDDSPAVDNKTNETKAALVQETPTFIPHGVLPLGQGAYLWDKAVQERTVDFRKVCEEAKAKGDYSDKLWQECYKLGGDYTDVRPIDHERAAYLGGGPQPMGHGDAASGAAAGTRKKTEALSTGSENEGRSGAATAGISMLALIAAGVMFQ